MKRLFCKFPSLLKKSELPITLKKYAALQIKKALLLLLVTGTSIPAFSQWTVLNSGITNTLRAPYFINENIGVVVGEAIAPGEAPILKTTDGGLTWVSEPSGTLNNLRGVHFIDDTTGYAVGFTGTILRTTDAGESWTSISSGTTQALRSVYFPSHSIGYIAGGAGTMLKTTDAGLTWTPQTTNVTQDLINVRFYNNDVGYAVSSTSTFTNGIVIKTENGGTTWTSVYTNTQGLLGLAVIDANTAYAGGGDNSSGTGNAYIVKTTDGGLIWTQVYTGTANVSLRGAFFTSANAGWFVGDLGQMPHTNDAGTTWTNDSVQLNGLLGIQFPTASVGYAVGAAGVILKYSAPSVCPPPTGLSVPNITATNASVQWDAVADAIGYKISYHPAGVQQAIKKSSSVNSKVLKNLAPGTTYKWGVQSICATGPQVASTFVMGPDFTTAPYRLSGEDGSLDITVFPNPASENATISFTLDDSSPVTITLFDVSGKLVRAVENATYSEGNHQVSFSSKQLPDGIYLLQLRTNEEVIAKKLLVEH